MKNLILVVCMLVASSALAQPTDIPEQGRDANQATLSVIDKVIELNDRVGQATSRIQRLENVTKNTAVTTTNEVRTNIMALKRLARYNRRVRAKLKALKEKVEKNELTIKEMAEVINQLRGTVSNLTSLGVRVERIERGEFTDRALRRIERVARRVADDLILPVSERLDEVEEKLVRPSVTAMVATYGLRKEGTALLAPMLGVNLEFPLGIGYLYVEGGLGYAGQYDSNGLMGVMGCLGYGGVIDYEFRFGCGFCAVSSSGFTEVNSDNHPTTSQFMGGQVRASYTHDSSFTVGAGVLLGADAHLTTGWDFSVGLTGQIGWRF